VVHITLSLGRYIVSSPLQEQLLLIFGTLQLVGHDLLQEFVLVVVQAQVEITPRSPSPRRQEKRMAVEALVGDDFKKTLAGVLQGREFDSQALDVVKRLFRQDFGLDIPDDR
jgi:hypothetical protein